ncbi:MAG: hypothetical protein IPL30_07930 [Elusimicrobia bacterium]|nr:hypothetical protein [Elusimicrobiota bacterium]
MPGLQGKLGPPAQSPEVGAPLLTPPACPLELRASIILGSGSPSFEIIRSLVERLPVMVTPDGCGVRAQPIFIDDGLAYLPSPWRCPCPVRTRSAARKSSYGALMNEYARQRGPRRWMIPVRC